jgi:CRP-like cAMP-binding protein
MQTFPIRNPDPLNVPKLSDQQLALLHRHGVVRTTTVGQVLFREGDPSYDFSVVLAGRIAFVQGYGSGAERELTCCAPREFIAELNLLRGQRIYVTAVVREAGSILVVPRDGLGQAMAEDSRCHHRRRQLRGTGRAGIGESWPPRLPGRARRRPGVEHGAVPGRSHPNARRR